jgi:hypothetical protein
MFLSNPRDLHINERIVDVFPDFEFVVASSNRNTRAFSSERVDLIIPTVC